MKSINYFKLASAPTLSLPESFFHKLIHHVGSYKGHIVQAQNSNSQFIKFDKISTPDLNNLTVSFFKGLPDDLHKAISILHERSEKSQYTNLIQYLINNIVEHASDPSYLRTASNTALQQINSQNAFEYTYDQVAGSAEEAMNAIETKYLNLFKAIQSGIIPHSEKKNEFMTFTPVEKQIKSALRKFAQYQPRVDIKQFIDVYIFGGLRSDFHNKFADLIKKNPPAGSMGEEGIENIAQELDVERPGWINYDDLKKFIDIWSGLSPAQKTEIFHSVFEELYIEYNRNSPKIVKYLKSKINEAFSKLNAYAQTFHTVVSSEATNIQKGYKINRLMNVMNGSINNDESQALESIISEIIRQDDMGVNEVPGGLSTEDKRGQVLNNNREFIQGLSVGKGKLHHGFKNGEEFANAKTVKATVLNKEYLSGLLWAKTLIQNADKIPDAERSLHTAIIVEANKLARLPIEGEDEIEVAAVRHHLFNYLFLSAIIHGASFYAPSPMTRGKTAKGFDFESIVTKYFAQELEHYQIPENIAEDFKLVAAEIIDTEPFRNVRETADLMRRELAESYAIHLLGFRVDKKLTDEQVDAVANRVYDLLYSHISKNFSLKKSGPKSSSVVVPEIQKEDALDVIKKEIVKRNDLIVAAAKDNPKLRVDQLPLNWRDIMGKEEDHQDKFFNRNLTHNIMAFNNNNINIKKASEKNEFDLVYLKWLIQQGIV